MNTWNRVNSREALCVEGGNPAVAWLVFGFTIAFLGAVFGNAPKRK